MRLRRAWANLQLEDETPASLRANSCASPNPPPPEPSKQAETAAQPPKKAPDDPGVITRRLSKTSHHERSAMRPLATPHQPGNSKQRTELAQGPGRRDMRADKTALGTMV